MQQRINPDESFEDWVARVREFELAAALKDLAHHENAQDILEQMSRKIINKIMHPIKLAWLENEVHEYNRDGSRFDYDEYYIKRFAPKADHITRDQ